MWNTVGAVLAVMAPLVGVPLTAITFYLRSLREHLIRGQEQLVRRMEDIERATTDIRKTTAEIERDYTSKDEWLRECMHTRRLLERLIEVTVRLDATMQGGGVVRKAEAQTRAAHPEAVYSTYGDDDACDGGGSVLREAEGNA